MKTIIYSLLLLTFVTLFVSCRGYYYRSQKLTKTIVFDSSYTEKKNRTVLDFVDGLTVVSTFDSQNRLIDKSCYSVYKNNNKDLLQGLSEEYDSTGAVIYKANYDNNKLHGELKTFHSNGRLKREELFQFGKSISGKCYDSTGKEISFFQYVVEPVVDIDLLSKCLVYPEELRRKNVEEDILIDMLLDEKGKIILIEYDPKHSKQLIDQIPKCLFKLPIQTLIIDGTPSKCRVTIPIRFWLTD